MQDNTPTPTIQVQYKLIDNAHFFTSNDPLGKGLCAAHKDLVKALNEVQHQLEILLRENHGIVDPFRINYTT